MLACREIRLKNKISYTKTTSQKKLCNTEGHSLVKHSFPPLSSYTLSSSHSDFTLVLAYFCPRAFAHGVPLPGIFLLFLTGPVIPYLQVLSSISFYQRDFSYPYVKSRIVPCTLLVFFIALIIIDSHLFIYLLLFVSLTRV